MKMKLLFVLAASLVSSAALANGQVALTSNVFVEKQGMDTAGRNKLVLEEPKLVVPGDKLVFVLQYQNKSGAPANNFVVTNPLPNAVTFQAALNDGAVVSVDGGHSWGMLATLKVKDGATLRNANAADVTHIRWTFTKPIPAGSAGKLMFRGIVR